MIEIEKERTYLLTALPDDIENWEVEHLIDIYLPKASDNPQMRLRKRGHRYYLTKKYPLNKYDLSTMIEETINLSKIEYDLFEKSLEGNRLAKMRYKRVFNTWTIEIDRYLESLSPLLILDIECQDSLPTKELPQR